MIKLNGLPHFLFDLSDIWHQSGDKPLSEPIIIGVYIDAQLTWKRHIEYTCSKLSKCAGIFLKARKKLNKGVLISLYYSFAYPYFMHSLETIAVEHPISGS